MDAILPQRKDLRVDFKSSDIPSSAVVYTVMLVHLLSWWGVVRVPGGYSSPWTMISTYHAPVSRLPLTGKVVSGFSDGAVKRSEIASSQIACQPVHVASRFGRSQVCLCCMTPISPVNMLPLDYPSDSMFGNDRGGVHYIQVHTPFLKTENPIINPIFDKNTPVLYQLTAEHCCVSMSSIYFLNSTLDIQYLRNSP
jgi:hypothetical protein